MNAAEWKRLEKSWREAEDATRGDYGQLTRQTSRRLLCAAIAAAGVLAVLYAGFRS